MKEEQVEAKLQILEVNNIQEVKYLTVVFKIIAVKGEQSFYFDRCKCNRNIAYSMPNQTMKKRKKVLQL